MLSVRALTEEQMDAGDLDPAVYTRVLADLAKVNSVTLARRPTLAFLDKITASSKPLKILDVGFGNGDMLRAIARWGEKRGRAVELTGIDLNPKSASAARSATPESTAPESTAINYQTGDYADLAGQNWDVILSSLVAHHMSHPQLIAFLRFMEAEAEAGWHINDLHRHSFAYTGYPLLARIMGWHRIVRQDGQLSIARSYRPAEWGPLLQEAGIAEAQTVRRFPFRLCVDRYK